MFYRRIGKRIFDIVLSLFAIIILSPVLLFTALLVRVKLGSPVLFRQKRPGYKGKIFGLYKFRSMTDGRDEKGELLPDEERLTSFGKWLRASSLDELPEFFNILKGDMSFVGPRPLLVQYLPLYNEEQSHRHDCLPGLTGLAQVNGRNAISWEEKFAYDVEYARSLSFMLDMKIIFQTFAKVIKRDGIHSESSATMEVFTGTKKECPILVLSAGRRVELIELFKAARDRLRIRGDIVAADASSLAPALYFADKKEIVPRISDNDAYIAAIIEICKKYAISLIVPTIDTELILLSERKEEIEGATGAKVLVSDSSVIHICRDKRNTQDFLEKNGFLAPHRFTEEELKDKAALPYPLFIKPIDGSSSIQAYKVNNAEELDSYLELVEKPMVQQCMEGTEFTVDAFLDFEGRLISLVPRRRIAVRSGEIAKGSIVKDREIMDDVTRLMQALKPIGQITVQCMKTERGIEYIEINPRFGGGAPMSIMAGADSCEYLYRLMQGEKLDYSEDYRDGLTFLRFDKSIALDQNMEILDPTVGHD